jgi:glutamyl-tRNA reductase
VDLVVLGISHKTAPVEQREKAALSESAARALMQSLRRDTGLSEVVALSTCNRTEVYAVGHAAADVEGAVRDAILGHTRIDPAGLDCARYEFRGTKTAAHLFRVASSLDSMVVGEGEIQGQVKVAWELAVEEGCCGPLLGRLFQQALEVGKRVRNETAIGKGAISVSSVGVDLACEVHDEMQGRRVLVIGAGQMAEATTRALVDHGIGEVTIINRTVSTARELAAGFGGRGVSFDRLHDELAEADIVISSTDAPHLILSAAEVRDALVGRPDRPMVLIDIAVPRDLDPAIGEIEGVTLHDIDDLEQVVEANLNGRSTEASRGEVIVEEEAERFAAWRRGLAVVPTISTLRDHAERIRSGELARVANQWESLSEADRERLDQLTQGIVNKLLHEPIVRARAAAANGEGLRHTEILRQLFGLRVGEKDPTSS